MKCFALLLIAASLAFAPLAGAEDLAVPAYLLELQAVERAIRMEPPQRCEQPRPLLSSRAPDCALWGTQAVCEAAVATCDQSFGSKTCWAVNQEQQRLRGSDPTLALRIFGFASQRFHQWIRDPDFQSQCCKDNSRCRSHLSRTGLYVMKGAGFASELGEYDPQRHRVIVSESVLQNCFDESCIERLLLHELGHACQYSLVEGTPGAKGALDLTEDQPCRIPGKGLFGYREALGEKTSACLQAALESHSRSLGRKQHCPARWRKEAFANAVFARYLKTPAHWAWNCSVVGGPQHADPRSYMGCILDIPEVKANFCPI